MSRSMPFTTSIIGAAPNSGFRDAVGKGDPQPAERGPAAASLEVRPVGEVVDARLLGEPLDQLPRQRRKRIRRAVEARRRRQERARIGMRRRGEQRRRPSPSSTTRPAWSTVTVWQSLATSPRSWVTNSTAAPSRCWRSWIRRRIWRCTVTSSAVVGSSATTSRGRQAKAMAIRMRWRMPPDSSCG